MAVILAVNMLVIGIFGSYQTAQAAEIVAGYTAGQILESILLGFGISIFTTEMVQKGTSAAWWDTDGSAALKPYYDDLEQAYEEQRFKVINGGGGQNPEPSPTPAPGSTPIPFPTTVPVPGDIPTFKELVAPALAGGAAVINMTQGAWECMAEAVSSLWNKMMGRPDNISDSISEDDVNLILSSSCPYYVVADWVGWKTVHYIYLYGVGSYTCNKSLIGYGPYYEYQDGVLTSSSSGGVSTGDPKYDSRYKNVRSNLPYFATSKEASDWSAMQRANADKYKKENIWVHPDLQDTYKNNGKLEYPQQAPRPLQIPSGEQLADTVKKLNPEINPNYSPEIAPSYIQELIQQLQKQPDPNPNPDP